MTNYKSSSHRRDHIVSFNAEKIRNAYASAVLAGMKQPVAFVLDLLDEDAKQLACVLQKGKTIEDIDKEIASIKDAIPTLYAILPKENILRILEVFQKVLHDRNPANPPISQIQEILGKSSPPSKSFFVLSVSGGKRLSVMSEPQNLTPTSTSTSTSIEIKTERQQIIFGQSVLNLEKK